MSCWLIWRIWLGANIDDAGPLRGPRTSGYRPFLLDTPPFDFAATG